MLDAMPVACRRALDVGCGEGRLARRLAECVDRVVGLDVHAPTVDIAASHPGPEIDYVVGDLLRHPFVPGSFDLVSSIAALHHGPTEPGLTQLASLVAPGGVLVVIGLARSTPRDWPVDAAGAIATRWHGWRKTKAESSAPIVWPPPDTYATTKRAAEGLLPGVVYRRHAMFRYSLTWRRPAA